MEHHGSGTAEGRRQKGALPAVGRVPAHPLRLLGSKGIERDRPDPGDRDRPDGGRAGGGDASAGDPPTGGGGRRRGKKPGERKGSFPPEASIFPRQRRNCSKSWGAKSSRVTKKWWCSVKEWPGRESGRPWITWHVSRRCGWMPWCS